MAITRDAHTRKHNFQRHWSSRFGSAPLKTDPRCLISLSLSVSLSLSKRVCPKKGKTSECHKQTETSTSRWRTKNSFRALTDARWVRCFLVSNKQTNKTNKKTGNKKRTLVHRSAPTSTPSSGDRANYTGAPSSPSSERHSNQTVVRPPRRTRSTPSSGTRRNRTKRETGTRTSRAAATMRESHETNRANDRQTMATDYRIEKTTEAFSRRTSMSGRRRRSGRESCFPVRISISPTPCKAMTIGHSINGRCVSVCISGWVCVQVSDADSVHRPVVALVFLLSHGCVPSLSRRTPLDGHQPIRRRRTVTGLIWLLFPAVFFSSPRDHA